MSYRKATLRRMSPEQRKFAKMADELESASKRLRKFVDTVGDLERDSRALGNATGSKVKAPEQVSTGDWPPCPKCGGEIKGGEGLAFGCVLCPWPHKDEDMGFIAEARDYEVIEAAIDAVDPDYVDVAGLRALANRLRGA